MSKLTRDVTAETVSRDRIVRREQRQGNINMPCSVDYEQDWQPYPVDSYSCYMCHHTYIRTYMHGMRWKLVRCHNVCQNRCIFAVVSFILFCFLRSVLIFSPYLFLSNRSDLIIYWRPYTQSTYYWVLSRLERSMGLEHVTHSRFLITNMTDTAVVRIMRTLVVTVPP